MPTPLFQRLFSFCAHLRYFLPAAALFSLAACITHPVGLIFLLMADTLLFAAICHRLGYGPEKSFLRAILRRGTAYFVLLAGYTGIIALLVTYPLVILLHDGSLTAVIALSVALVFALLSIWRIWPTFGLVFVWDDAYSDSKEPLRMFTAIASSLKLGIGLTGEEDIFFRQGLMVAVSLLVIAGGALGLAGVGGVMSQDFHLTALVIYAVIAAPLGHYIIARRSRRALLGQLSASVNEQSNKLIHNPHIPSSESPFSVFIEETSSENLHASVLNAARTGQIDLALAGLDNGADPNVVPDIMDRDQRSLLMLASTMTDLRLLRTLIAKGADINRIHGGLTVLLVATRDSYQGRAEVVMMLLANGADPRCTDSEQNTPLHYAALNADPTIAAMLLDAGAPISAINREALTPLGMACRAANWTLMRFFMEHGAKTEVEHAQPALLAASATSDDDATGVKLLLKRKAKVDVRGLLGRTALMNAALHGHTAIAKALLEAGADVNLIDHHGTTALMEAARSGADLILQLMFTYRPLPDLKETTGRTALMIACQSHKASEETIKQLLALGANTQLIFPNGKTIAEFAAQAGRWTLVALLDPTFPIPVNVAEIYASKPPADAATPAHLLDALRFGHWIIAHQFDSIVRDWKSSELAKLYLGLVAPEYQAARFWLLNRGFDPNVTECTFVLNALIEQLPLSQQALQDWLNAGAQAGGAGFLLKWLQAFIKNSLDPDQREEIEKFAINLLERGADFCGVDCSTGHSALHLAVSLGLSTLTCVLLDRGCNPNSHAKDGTTPLHAVTQLPISIALAMLPTFLKSGANVSTTANNNETPLGLALNQPDSEIKKWFHWSRWQPPKRRLFPADTSAAATLGDLEAVKKLLHLGFSVNATDRQGASALLHAAGSGHVDLVEFLLNNGADATLAAKSGATALTAAICGRHTSVLPPLFAHGIMVDQRLPGGGTALMLATGLGFPEMVGRLLLQGATVGMEDEEGCSALHRAAQFAFASTETPAAKRILELLLQHGIDIDHCNKIGQNSLLLLLGADRKPGIRVDQQHLLALLAIFTEHGAQLNVQDQRGVTALHACAIHGLLLPARALLLAGANPHLVDVFERTPSMVAKLLGYVDLAKELSTTKPSIPGPAQTLKKRLDDLLIRRN